MRLGIQSISIGFWTSLEYTDEELIQNNDHQQNSSVQILQGYNIASSQQSSFKQVTVPRDISPKKGRHGTCSHPSLTGQQPFQRRVEFKIKQIPQIIFPGEIANSIITVYTKQKAPQHRLPPYLAHARLFFSHKLRGEGYRIDKSSTEGGTRSWQHHSTHYRKNSSNFNQIWLNKDWSLH